MDGAKTWWRRMGGWHHRVRLGGRGSPKATTEQAYRIPKAVIEYFCGINSVSATSTPQQPPNAARHINIHNAIPRNNSSSSKVYNAARKKWSM